MGYSGAIAMCSGKMYFPHNGRMELLMTLLLSIVILTSLALNFRGQRTYLAALLAVTGITFVILAQTSMRGAEIYTLGSILVVLAVWTNTSLFYILSKIKNIIHSVFIQKSAHT
ncbi:MAG: hypothetical protein KTR24_02850 [Saprospiraceae bacterium]|nr:hypothetical protein [Saprospiraceae bacterium]